MENNWEGREQIREAMHQLGITRLDGGETISDSYKANSIHRTIRASSLFTSAELDALERPFKIPSAQAHPAHGMTAY